MGPLFFGVIGTQDPKAPRDLEQVTWRRLPIPVDLLASHYGIFPKAGEVVVSLEPGTDGDGFDLVAREFDGLLDDEGRPTLIHLGAHAMGDPEPLWVRRLMASA